MRIPYARTSYQRLRDWELGRRYPGRAKNAACEACGNPHSRQYPVRRRRDGYRTHKDLEACRAAARARIAAEQAARR